MAALFPSFVSGQHDASQVELNLLLGRRKANARRVIFGQCHTNLVPSKQEKNSNSRQWASYSARGVGIGLMMNREGKVRKGL